MDKVRGRFEGGWSWIRGERCPASCSSSLRFRFREDADRFGANLAICILPRLLQPLATPSAFNKPRSKRANGALSNIRPGPSCEGKENADTGDRRKGDGTRIATNAADIRKGMVNFVFLKKCLELLQMFISSWMQSA